MLSKLKNYKITVMYLSIIPSTFDTLELSLTCPAFEAFLFAPAVDQPELAQYDSIS